MREGLRIGEVAEVLGISANAVRYYHEAGLVPEPERSEGGYRLYGAREVLPSPGKKVSRKG
jgi:DNA-binding transcriptional MerR regulator